MRALLFKLLLPLLVVVGVWKPFYGLFTYIFFNIVRPEMLFWGGRQGAIVFKVAFVSTLVGYFSQPSGSDIKPMECREFWLLLWIVVAVAVSLLLTDIPLHRKAWSFAFEIVKLWLLAWLILGIVTTPTNMLRIQNWMLYAVTFISVWGIDQHFRGNARLEGLAGGSVADSNGVAAIGVLFFTIALNKFLTGRNYKERGVGLAATGAIAALIVFTQSRGGFLGMIASVAVLLSITRKKRAMAITLIAAVILCSPYLAGEYKQRLSSITVENSGDRDYSSASRLVLWQAGVLMFVDHPLFGVGILNFPRAKGPYQHSLAGRVDPDLLAYCFRGYKVGHSTYFGQILPEGGLFLAIPCALLILHVFSGYLKVRKQLTPEQKKEDPLWDLLAGFIAGIVGHCVSILFIDGFFMLFLPMQLVFAGQVIRLLQLKNDQPGEGRSDNKALVKG